MTSAAEYARRLGLEAALEQLGVAHHARERLVQLVRGGARELGDDGLPLLREDLLLRLREALLHAHLLAQVGEDADRADRRVALVEQRRRERHGDALAVRVEHLGAEPFDAPAAGA